MLLLLASVVYLLLAHTAALTGSQVASVAAIVVLVAMTLVMLRGLLWLQLALLAAVVACFVLSPQPIRALMYAPPVLFPLLLAALFGRSLLPGRQPLVERIVWHMHGRPALLDEKHRRYARGVTTYWCAVFVLMAVINLVLAWWAPLAVWSWVGNVAAYAMPLIAMLAEYAWRKHIFPVQPYRNLFDYLLRMVRLGPTLARDLGHDWRSDDDGTAHVRS